MQTTRMGTGRRPRHLPRLTRARIAVIAVGVAATATVGGVVASAAVPTFPDNVVVFPDRDFVTIEGYQDHIGEDATVTVMRGTTLMGSAVGKVAEGDVAFEINHPGGYCWGAGGGPNVTPDIQKGDKVSIKFADGTSGDTTVSTGTAKWKTGDFRVTGTSSALNGTVTVHRANADGSAGAQIGTATALTPAVAGATGSTYDWRLRTGVPTTNPGRIVVKSNTGALSQVVTPTNG